MAAKNCPETPRQRMINLMYLVLIAMLAMNVDKSVLDAFVMVDKGLRETVENFKSKNERIYSRFESAASLNEKKVGELNREMQVIKARTNELSDYIDSLKMMLAIKTDGPEGRDDSIKNKENTHKAAEIMLVKGKGTELKERIVDYRNILVSKLSEKDSLVRMSIEKSLNTSDPPPKEGKTPSWEISKFEGYPLVSVITLMTKMQNDLRYAESELISHMYTEIDAESYKFNKLQAVVVQNSNFVLEGNEYKAKIFLTAVDSTQKHDIKVGNQLIPIDESGIGIYRVPNAREGRYSRKGNILFKGPDGNIKPYKFDFSYQVAKPTMTVSPTKMNVFYAGIENPVSISVPGVPADKVMATITNGRISARGRGYVVYPGKPGIKSVISVRAKLENGKVVNIGSTEFRVKRVPNPIATVAGKNEGLIDKNVLLNEQGVFAEIPDFDFKMNFKVTSFVVLSTREGYTDDKKASGNRFTNDQISLMKRLNSGSRLIIEDIIAKGDDGSTRKLPAISFKIK